MNPIKFTGSRNIALGVDTKVVPSGLCSNSNIIPLEEKLRDPLNPINRCIFCRDGIHCYFAGECKNKKTMKV